MSAVLQTAPPAMSDDEVVQQVLSGEVGLFEVLMRRHNPRLYRALRGIVRDEAQVEELMQETYVRAYEALRDFGGRAQFSTWLLRIGINLAMSRVRRARLVPMTHDEKSVLALEAPMSSDPEHATSDRQLAELLERAVDALPDGYREVFMLRQVEGLSVADTAEALSLSEEAVKTRLFRGQARLRELLESWLDGAGKGAFAFYAPRCNRVVAAVMARIRR